MKRCRICGSSGIIYDRDIKAGTHGELRICDCIEKLCSCGGAEPYQVFDNKGNFSWCPCRSARLKLATVRKAFKEAQVPNKYKWKFIEDFEIVNDVAQKLIGMVTTVVRDIEPRPDTMKGYYFWGAAGSGKTLLACIILQELMLKYALGGRFVDLSRQFFQRLKRSYDSTDELYGSGGQILDALIEIPFLVVDDFGVQRNTEWESEMLYNLIDSRYEMEHLTIITSNIHINDYKEIAHGRIHSRIKEMCSVIKVDLPDYRDKYLREHNFT
ncbi:ATP-binding protein [bacterium]|nr:ATP-binding protein [bacterium]